MINKRNISLVASFLLATNLYSQQTSLDEITISSATKSEEKLKNVTANVDVITAEDIESRKFKTVAEALNSLVGVSISSNGGIGQTSSVYLRGMDSKRTLVLIDGIRYNDITTTNGAANFEHLMINDIERIEVIKGAQSSIWGADASAGVVNIITKSAKDGTHGNATIEYGRYNSKTAKANISHKNENFDAKLGVVRVDTDGFSAKSPKSSEAKNYEDDGYENTTVNLKLGYNFDQNNRVSTSYEIIDTKVNFDSKPDDKISKANTLTHLANITYENRNDIALTKIYGNYTDIKREYSTNTPKYKGIVKEYGVNTSINYLTSSNVTLGADYKKFENKANLNKDYNNKGIFISNTNKFFDDKTIFTQALRYDRYSDFENKTTGKVGIKQYIIDDLNISSNYGTGYNVPNLYQLHDVWVGNDTLQPEKTKSYDVSIAYEGFSVTYFNTKIKDMIDYNYATWTYDQMSGTSKIKGTEIAYKNEVIEDILLNLSYTNLSAKDANGDKLLNRPTNKFNFGVDYYGLKDFHININGSYIGTNFSPKSGVYPVEGTKTGNYTVWNAVVDYDISKNFSTYLKLDNIFNKDYQIVDGYATSQRAAYVGLKASF
ncbi:TonB-dependent receptor plug domain-containing protein [Aliarcobacter cryaerophilus]|uniref:TonB-dependent receptor plug domain-containing protein n=1 Tax=Aliarcobacter cryaerophilus TaxID=28198 RepID=UPI0021B27693|nr:TonB-dependent receptor [Aliarcobacter cryaerophilus]MCT7443947.1 TonB-dependent receptor [Aliarcobacter cryaerophilus]MCT7478565.1 TonB-dependent receptor [Aliarcobacter cryaerophilus]